MTETWTINQTIETWEVASEPLAITVQIASVVGSPGDPGGGDAPDFTNPILGLPGSLPVDPEVGDLWVPEDAPFLSLRWDGNGWGMALMAVNGAGTDVSYAVASNGGVVVAQGFPTPTSFVRLQPDRLRWETTGDVQIIVSEDVADPSAGSGYSAGVGSLFLSKLASGLWRKSDTADTDWELVGSGGGGGAVDSVNGATGDVVLDAADVGAATAAQGALADTAVQPGDLGEAATRNVGTGSGDVAAGNAPEAAAAAAVAALVGAAPVTLDTLAEIAAALGSDPNLAATITAALAGKQPLDADLTAIAALSTTAFGRGLLELATATALRAAAELGDAATKNVGTTAGTVMAGDTVIPPAGIAASLIDAKGDLIVGSAADTPARLAVGANGYTPVATSGATVGVEWRRAWPTLPCGSADDWFGEIGNPAWSPSSSLVAGYIMAKPFYVGQDCDIDQIFVRSATANASATVRLGLYLPDGTGGYPGTLISGTAHSGTISTSSTGRKSASITASLKACMIWAVSQTGGAATGTTGPTPTMALPSRAADAGYNAGLYAVRSDAALPSDLTGTSWTRSGATVPHQVGVRIA